MTTQKYTQNVCLFCGGRGSATLIRALLRRPEVNLSLLVNAYDDGLSTGALRDFVPGMLGPSDFRKNLSYLLDLYSAEQYALQKLIEFRLPEDFSADDLKAFRAFVDSGSMEGLKKTLLDQFSSIDTVTRDRIRGLLGHFFRFYDKRIKEVSFEFVDCSLGNLVFAGAFLEQGNDFNEAARLMSEVAGSKSRLINVSKGEARTLVALKTDGELMPREAVIVGPQSAVPILDLYFMECEPSKEGWLAIADKPIEEKRAWLRSQEMKTEPSIQAIKALQEADIIIYGPGTQHSSLLPSYLIASEAILSSPATVKAFVANIQEDHDIQATTGLGLVDKSLHCLGDETNSRKGITHIFYTETAEDLPDGIKLGQPDGEPISSYKGATLLRGKWANPAKPMVHSGLAISDRVIELFETSGRDKQDLRLFIDLGGRNLGIDPLIQEMLEIPWSDYFDQVDVVMNVESLPTVKGLPSNITMRISKSDQPFPEIAALQDWVVSGKPEFFATLSGDGEYNLSDIILGMRLLQSSRFGALHGSRTQSRRQFHNSLHAAYGEGGPMFRMSWFGSFLVSALLALRVGMFFSDPLTGFRLYRKSRISPSLAKVLTDRLPNTPVEVTKELVHHEVEIAEMPVRYRTYTGFTRPKWRFNRGLKNLFGVFR